MTRLCASPGSVARQLMAAFKRLRKDAAGENTDLHCARERFDFSAVELLGACWEVNRAAATVGVPEPQITEAADQRPGIRGSANPRFSFVFCPLPCYNWLIDTLRHNLPAAVTTGETTMTFPVQRRTAHGARSGSPVCREGDQAGRRALRHQRRVPLAAHSSGLAVCLMNVNIPEQYGGPGLDVLGECIVNEELAWGCSGIQTAG